MKFFEYDLYFATYKVYLRYEKAKLKPRSADWFIYHEKRTALVDDILEEMRLLNRNLDSEISKAERILKAWDDFGKNKEKYKTLIQVAESTGRGCYRNGLFSRHSICSDIMTCEHTPNGTRIVCKKHFLVRNYEREPV